MNHDDHEEEHMEWTGARAAALRAALQLLVAAALIATAAGCRGGGGCTLSAGLK